MGAKNMRQQRAQRLCRGAGVEMRPSARPVASSLPSRGRAAGLPAGAENRVRMIIDAHAHVCAISPGHGKMAERLMKSLPFRFMRWRLGIVGSDEQSERQIESKLV